MAETIQGGAYKAADGTWHDAHGNKLNKEQAVAAEKLLAERAEELEAEERAAQERLLASQRVVVVQAPTVAAPSPKTEKGKKAKS